MIINTLLLGLNTKTFTLSLSFLIYPANKSYKSSVYVTIRGNVWKKWKYIYDLVLKSKPVLYNPNSISYYVKPLLPKPKLLSLPRSINVKLAFENYQIMTANQIHWFKHVRIGGVHIWYNMHERVNRIINSSPHINATINSHY